MKISIRDDDLNYFTTVDELEKCYGSIIKDIPITLAAIPFVTENFFKMSELTGSRHDTLIKIKNHEKNLNKLQLGNYYQNHPLGFNQELIDYLNENKERYEIALHGNTHRFYSEGAEYKLKNLPSDLISDGNRYLELLFNRKINFFVPPSNMFNFSHIDSLIDNNLSLLTSASIYTDNIKDKLCLNFNKIMNKNYIKNRLSKKGTYTYKVKNLTVLTSITFQEWMTAKDFFDKTVSILEQHGYLSIATHYLLLKQQKNYYKEFYDYLNLVTKHYNIQFTSSSNLLNQL
ncbi:hypothetical protein [Providencia sp. PROV036]|uniref:hypothetical protein n=1 Tax=Providencia sp. PROV036 TaxID=2949767 RepID=UPI0023493A5C|nr:hypothetical protein [Providencia sp. PROV036]